MAGKALSRGLRLLAGLWLALLAFSVWAEDPVAVPPLAGRVTDTTGTLSREQAASLDAQLAAFEAAKGSQIAILIVPTTKPEPIEAFGMRVAESWKLGRKGIDDGIIVIVAKNDRRLRIEVGYGLEGVVNDATAKRIISETITPRLREGDFFGGLQAGVRQIVKVVEGEALPAPDRGGKVEVVGDAGAILFGAVMGVAFLAPILRVVFGRLPTAGLAGGAVAALGWFLGVALVTTLLLEGFAFVAALVAGGRPGRGGWPGGGLGGGLGGGGWSGGSSGGYSGGGGGFGGGGSSGSW